MTKNAIIIAGEKLMFTDVYLKVDAINNIENFEKNYVDYKNDDNFNGIFINLE